MKDKLGNQTLLVAAQFVRMDFGFSPQPVLSLTGLVSILKLIIHGAA
jgi:hypothetical protein